MKKSTSLSGSAACVAMVVCAGHALAQTTFEPNGGQLRFEVLNPQTGTWGSTYPDAMSGEQVEFRVVASYIGTRTDLFAMGEVLYQPTISNVDNTGAGSSADQIAPYLNGGNGGNSVANSMLNEIQGNSILPLSGYGRVRFGGTACTATGSNTMTSFRHNSDNGSPAGSWIRLAGTFVTQWPQALPGVTDATNINRILRGISSQQQSQSLAPLFHVAGTQNIVIFRQAIILSDSDEVREMQFSTFNEAFRRVGGTTSTDDTRYMSWQTGAADSGSHRTSVTIVPATIWVNVPAPGGAAIACVGLVLASRRRR
ncbi:MAG TPA: hypothetical protein VHN77_16040 [Phycisphaerales bacterium]|nr:hypothetical protein [Phycisphaerales bacterium]